MTKQNFSFASSNFWTLVLSFIFGVLAMTGLEFQQSPDELAGTIITTLDTQGFIGAVGLIVTNAFSIIYHVFFKKREQPFWGFLSSTNFWVQLVNFVLGLLVLYLKVPIEAGVAEALVAAAYAKDWVALGVSIFVSVITPIIRALKDKFGAARILVAPGAVPRPSLATPPYQ